MCEIFVSTDPALYEQRTRSIRLHGAVTSVRLEEMFWRTLEEIGARDGMNVSQLLCTLHDEIEALRGNVDNFASFLRVCCLRYQALQISGGIPSDNAVSIRGLNARQVLRSLDSAHWQVQPEAANA
ncbi:MAG: hypothetical protein RL341_689 [Pseudomonadota bacterium]|jgi:predicted DNA-binding ribbon-helix-helix protein